MCPDADGVLRATRMMFVIGVFLTMVAAGLTVACLSSGPFASILARGRANTADLYDIRVLAAAFVCVTGECVTFRARRERHDSTSDQWLDVQRR